MAKILVVDDIEANRKVLKKTLVAIDGHAVVEAEDGEEAIVQFENECPDLILMDVNMPGMDGYESASKIKSITGESYIPIIFVTALSAKESLANAISSGGDDFIGKPFDVEVLESKINAQRRNRELNLQINDKRALIIFSGRATAAQDRVTLPVVMSDYFENENSDGDFVFDAAETEDYVWVIAP